MSRKEEAESLKKSLREFSGEIREMRHSLREALGLGQMRPLERLRMNTRAFGERIRPQEQPWQEQQQMPQQDQGGQGQRAATPLRPFGILDRFLQPLQPQEEPEQNLTPEEAEKLKQIRKDERRRLEAEEAQRRLDKVKRDTHFSVELD